MNAPVATHPTPPYKHTPLFPLGKDDTAYRQIATEGVRVDRVINAGGVLSGELNAIREAKTGKHALTYQLTSEPRRLPTPNGLCNLETGPETFQIVARSEAEAAQLKGFVGKEISLKVDEVACAENAGQISEAVVTKWSMVTRH